MALALMTVTGDRKAAHARAGEAVGVASRVKSCLGRGMGPPQAV